MVKIRIRDYQWAALFVENMNKLPCDVNLYDGSIVFDAKSILAIMSLDFSKVFKVECITNNKEIYEDFKKFIEIFKY